jgi:hypothetical protein
MSTQGGRWSKKANLVNIVCEQPLLSKIFENLREIGLKSPNVEQWNKKPYLQGYI